MDGYDQIQDSLQNFGGEMCKFGKMLEKCQDHRFFLHFLGHFT